MVGTRAQALSITSPTIDEIGIVIRVVFSGHTIEPKKRFKIGKKNPSLKREDKNNNLQKTWEGCNLSLVI